MREEVANWKSKGSYLTFQNKKIFYIQEGTGSPLLIIHGYPYSSFEWKETIKELSKEFSVTSFDLLGMGFSDKPQKHNYSYEEYCEIINELLTKLNINATHIISHDLGVSVVQELLAREAEGKNKFKLLSSVFINGSLFIDAYRPRFMQRVLSQSPKLIGKTISKLLSKRKINETVKSLFGPFTKPSDIFLDQQWEILNYNNGKDISYLIGRLVFEKYNYQERWITAMQNTTVPMCYICGPYDPNSGRHMAERYKELMPNPTVFLLDKYIGHWPHLEDQSTTTKYANHFVTQYLDNTSIRKKAI